MRGNIPPNPRLQGQDIQKRLARQAQEFLAKRDQGRIRRGRLQAVEKAERDERQARDNPALVADRQKALRLR